MTSPYTESPEMSSPLGVSSAQIAQALMKAYAAGDASAVEQLQGMYDLASEYEASIAKSTESAALTGPQQERADLIKALDLTENTMAGGSINYGPIGTRIEGIKSLFNAADPETLAFKNVVSGLRAAITKARAGASLTEGELKMLQKYTPSETDSEQVVRSKLQQLRNLYGYSAPTGGSSAQSLAEALMQSQNGY